MTSDHELEITNPALAHVLRVQHARQAKTGGQKAIVLVKHLGIFEGKSANERARLSGPGIGVGIDKITDHAALIHLHGYQFVLVGDWPRHVIIDYDGKSLLNIAQPKTG